MSDRLPYLTLGQIVNKISLVTGLCGHMLYLMPGVKSIFLIITLKQCTGISYGIVSKIFSNNLEASKSLYSHNDYVILNYNLYIYFYMIHYIPEISAHRQTTTLIGHFLTHPVTILKLKHPIQETGVVQVGKTICVISS